MASNPSGHAARRIAAALALMAAGGPCAAAGDAANTELSRLASMSLEELMQTEVTSVAGRPARHMASPAAMTVLSAEDLRRNGVRSVVEALRLVPGMFVGRINSGSWVAGARGLTGSSLTATRYLVLVDGRVVHDPLISTTFWDALDLVVEDIERIEVVRGPGATLWGANAMNGVVSVITRRAGDTLGTLASVGAGSNDEQAVTLRHGASLGGDAAVRVWGKYANHGDFTGPTGGSIGDAWSAARAGFRYDRTLASETRIMLEGDAYTHPKSMATVRLPVPGRDREFETRTSDDTVDGAHLLFRASHGFEGAQGWMLRAYYDRTRRETSRFDVTRDTVDVEYRRWMPWGKRNDLMWGLQYTHTRDETGPGPVLLLDPAARSWSTANAFVQNTTTLSPDTLFLMLGSKFTDHSFVGPQVQPSARLWWTPSDRQTVWAAVSRPVRVPSRFEEDGLLVFSYVDSGVLAGGPANGVVVPLGLSGDNGLRPEKLLAYELGHRVRVGDGWVFDTSLFHNDYQTLLGVPPAIFGSFTDAASGVTRGIEVSVSAQLTPRWRMQGAWSRLQTRIDGPVLDFDESNTPGSLAQLHSYLDLGETVELNAGVYRTGRAPGLGVEAYTRADVGLTWRPRPSLELSLWGQNLLQDSHREASGAGVPRTVFGQVTVHLAR